MGEIVPVGYTRQDSPTFDTSGSSSLPEEDKELNVLEAARNWYVARARLREHYTRLNESYFQMASNQLSAYLQDLLGVPVFPAADEYSDTACECAII